MEENYYTIKEASELLGIAIQTVRDYLSSGRLQGERIFTSTVISKQEIERYLKETEEWRESRKGGQK